MVAAERVAATVAEGVHGRRRVGLGDSFWQFRPFLPGDEARRIDWRKSAKSDRAFVRETEWEVAQTVFLWADASASMRWHSHAAAVEKRERAEILLLALALLLLRGGERVVLMRPGARALSGRVGLEQLAGELLEGDDEGVGLPPRVNLPRHARVVLFGDFLAPLTEIQSEIGRLASVPVSGHAVQILDPAEALLPYAGRVRFEGLEREAPLLIPRVDVLREAYAEKLAAQQDGLRAICGAAGFGFAVHRTDHVPEAALLALYAALATR
ncbi:MAG: DUF58 domain-containing protein [Acetobacteraceae bacterium]|nr:DUF58 domain-containing protein [Acetobacteraceae bacterium]